MPVKSVFITRDLKKTSVFKTMLEKSGIVVHGKSLLNFSPIAFSKIPESDWIFFYSKNGVKYFFEGLKKLNQAIPENKSWATIGEGTATLLKTYINQIDFIGNGDTLDTASMFLKLAKKQRILFPQAEDSRQSIQILLEGNIVGKDLIVYKNEPKKQVDIPDCDGLVFTSPMNAKAYFKNRVLFEDQKVFAIGRTTEKTLVSIGVEDYHVADAPSEEALAKLILNLKKAE